MADIEGLGLGVEMIELKHDRITLPAIDAMITVEIAEEIIGPLERERLLSSPSLIDVAPLVREVVLTVICRPALSAHVVELSVTFPPPSEL